MDISNSQQVIKLNLNNTPGEFTRRKNWSQSILDSLRDIVHVLNGDLRILYCSAASSEFLGYKPSELVNHLFTEFLHVDDIDTFVREFRACKTTYQIFQCSYRFLRKDGKYAVLETRGSFYKAGFFGNARRVPTESAQSIDSFLDLKMENEMLKRKLEQLKREHGGRETSVNSDSTNPSSSHQSMTTGTEDGDESDEVDEYMMPVNASNVYTQGVNTSYDINESLAMLTGLRYDLGERSVGISMGLQNGELTSVPTEELLSRPIIVSNAESIADRNKVSAERAGKKVWFKSIRPNGF